MMPLVENKAQPLQPNGDVARSGHVSAKRFTGTNHHRQSHIQLLKLHGLRLTRPWVVVNVCLKR